MKPGAVLLILFLSLLGGCVTPVRTLKPADIPSLPKPVGVYSGKLFPSPPWIYEGSTAQYHFFRYTYHRDYRLYSMRVAFARTDMPLSFELPLGAVPERGIMVTLGWEPSRGYHFIKMTSAPLTELPWVMPPDTVPEFDQTLDFPAKTQAREPAPAR